MFGTILTVIITILQLYVFLHIITLPFFKNKIYKATIILAGMLLWICFFLSRLWRHGSSSPSYTALEFISMLWMGSLFLTFIPVFFMDIATFFGLVFKKYKTVLRSIALVTGMLLSITAIIQGLRPPVITEYEVKIAGLDQKLSGLKIAAISDTHLGTLIGPKWFEKRVNQIAGLDPDMIFLLGDITEGHGEFGADTLAAFNSLKAPLGVWAVLGNHEFYGRRNSQKSLPEMSNINLLRNKWVQLDHNLIIAGIDDPRHNFRNTGNDVYMPALGNRPVGTTIFLSHSPVEMDRVSGLGVDLMLSGHTHGGQIWPFDYLVKRRYRYIEGVHEFGRMKLIITRGAGTWGPRMRLWQPGEILLVTLR